MRELLKMGEVQQLERLVRGHHEVAVAIVPLEGGGDPHSEQRMLLP